MPLRVTSGECVRLCVGEYMASRTACGKERCVRRVEVCEVHVVKWRCICGDWECVQRLDVCETRSVEVALRATRVVHQAMNKWV